MLEPLTTLAFVQEVQPLASTIYLATSSSVKDSQLGFALEQINGQVLIDQGLNGAGVSIGIIDGGFLKADQNKSLEWFFEQNLVKGYRDYITPQSEPYSGVEALDDAHGTQVWQMVGGLNSSKDIQYGLATHAYYYLARTDHGKDERRREEDFWIAAMEWMDSCGVQVINSSLGYTKGFDDLELIAKCTNAIEAFNLIQKEKIDVLFLDIQMPKLTGIDFLKNITNPPQVIFTTAYRDYALDGYDLNITDYLLKPFSFERFLKAINKVCLNSKTQDSNINQIKDEAKEQNIIYFKADKKMIKVWLDDIFYIESMKDYVFVKTPKKDIISYQKISFLDEKLPEHKFLRIHRSFIIAVDKVEAFCATHVDVAGKGIPIGRNYKNQVLKKLNQENLLNAD